MTKMKVVQVPKAGADFELVEREIPKPGAIYRKPKAAVGEQA
jgi:hypothetical protein